MNETNPNLQSTKDVDFGPFGEPRNWPVESDQDKQYFWEMVRNRVEGEDMAETLNILSFALPLYISHPYLESKFKALVVAVVLRDYVGDQFFPGWDESDQVE